MKKATLALSLFVLAIFSAQSVQAQLPVKLSSLKNIPANAEIANALKQALEQSTSKSVDQLSAVDGFFANAEVKILFPPAAKKAEKTLRSLGLNKLCDDVILSLNRAAEHAARQAAPIFMDAIKQMALQDALNILLGDKDAATQYFKLTTAAKLAASFRPVIKTCLDSANATRYYATAAATYNKIPFIKKTDPDITDYVTRKAIDGLFIEIAKEELNIRQNLSARTTPLMQKVFLFADKAKK